MIELDDIDPIAITGTYITDDRDYPLDKQRALCIFAGGNGDWYVGLSSAVNPQYCTEAVRLCTSGGASTAAPGLTVAIAEAWRAMIAAQNGIKYTPQFGSDERNELEAWRKAFPNKTYHIFDGIIDAEEE